MSLATIISLATVAWSAEYPGFVHFRNWDGVVEPLGSRSQFFLPSGDSMPPSLAKDFCASDQACTSFGWNIAAFRTMRYNSTRDLYLANSSTIAPGAFCSIESGGCLHPGRLWLHCGADFFDDRNLLATFNLPPDVVRASCVSNPKCVGFSVDNGGTSGSLYKDNGLSEGWFTVPTQAEP